MKQKVSNTSGEWASVLFVVMMVCCLFSLLFLGLGEVGPAFIVGIIAIIVMFGFIAANVYSNKHIRDRPEDNRVDNAFSRNLVHYTSLKQLNNDDSLDVYTFTETASRATALFSSENLRGTLKYCLRNPQETMRKFLGLLKRWKRAGWLLRKKEIVSHIKCDSVTLIYYIEEVGKYAECPYCGSNIRDTFYKLGGIVRCNKCGAFHHKECFEYYGRKCGSSSCKLRNT